MIHPDVHGKQPFVGDLLHLHVDLRKQLPQARHSRLLGQGLDVRPDVAVSHIRKPSQIDVGGQRHPSCVNGKYLVASLSVRYRDRYLPVEAPRTAKRWVEGVGYVCSSNNDDLPSGLKPVHQRKKLGHDASFNLLLPAHLLALGGDGVYLVYEDYRGSVRLSILEYIAKALLALAVELAYDLRAGDVGEVDVRLGGHGARYHGLSRAGRSVEEHALGGLHPEPVEHLGESERQLYHLADPLNLGA